MIPLWNLFCGFKNRQRKDRIKFSLGKQISFINKMITEPVNNNVVITEVLCIAVFVVLPVSYRRGAYDVPRRHQGFYSISTAADKYN